MTESAGSLADAKVVLYSTRGNAGFAFVVGLFLGALGLHFILHGAENEFFAWVLLLVAVGWIFYGLGELSRKTPQMTLDKEGLLTGNDHRIRWNEIRGVGFDAKSKSMRLDLANEKTETVSLAKLSMPPQQIVDAVKQLSDAAGVVDRVDTEAVEGARDEEIVSQAEYLKALALLQQSRYREAVDAFTLVVDLNPQNHVSYRGRALARMGVGDPDGALVDLEKAVELGPYDPDNYTCRAEVRRSKGDAAGATQDRDTAAKLAREREDEA